MKQADIVNWVLVFFILGLMSLFTIGIIKIVTVKPDNRTIQEVKDQKYKECLNYSHPDTVVLCKNFLD